MNPICTHCGKPLRINYEQVATAPTGDPIMDNVGYCDTCMIRYNNDQFVYPVSGNPQIVPPSRICKRCGSSNIAYQTITEKESAGCGMIFLYIILALTILGILVLIPILLSNNTKTVTYATCQSCGLRWRV